MMTNKMPQMRKEGDVIIEEAQIAPSKLLNEMSISSIITDDGNRYQLY